MGVRHMAVFGNQRRPAVFRATGSRSPASVGGAILLLVAYWFFFVRPQQPPRPPANLPRPTQPHSTQTQSPSAPPESGQGSKEEVHVVRVVDGDTLLLE